MAAGDASQTTPAQILHVFLYYTNCVHAISISVRVLLLILVYISYLMQKHFNVKKGAAK